MTMSAVVLVTSDRTLRVPLLVADRPRQIDTVIDYFGEASPRPAEARPAPRAVDRLARW
jgi:hypothetical protein